MPDKGDFITAVPPEGAAMQFFIESLKANTETMKALRDEIRTGRDEQRDDRKLIHDIHARVIKLESSHLARQVDHNRQTLVSHDARINSLEAKEDRREGQVQNLNTLHKWTPTVLAILFILISLVLTGVVKA